MADVDAILRLQSQMETDRANFDNQWRLVADRVRPSDSRFNTSRAPGQKLGEKIFDSTASLALERFAAALESLLTPRVQRWHGIEIPELKDNKKVRMYLDDVTDILFERRYATTANFASQAFESYISLGQFGNQCMFVDEFLGEGIRYKSCHIGQIYFAEDHQGVVDVVHRKFQMTARQLAQKFGTSRLPDKLKSETAQTSANMYDVIHHVGPQNEFVYGRSDYRGWPISSCYILMDGRVLLSEGGFKSMPYAVSRYITSPDEKYGRGPAMTVYADIATLNEMSKTMLRAGQKAVDPPILAPEDGIGRPFDLRPGAMNYGAVDDRGNQLVHAMNMGSSRIDLGLEMQEQRRKVINDAFLITLFQILVDTPEMTATEALIRAQEKGALLAPTMGRQQSEMLGPIIAREIDIHITLGNLPPPPIEILESGGIAQIVYTSPLSRLQKSEDGVGTMRLIDAITPLAQIDPAALDILDVDEAAYVLADVYGVPARVLRTMEEVKAVRKNRSDQQNAEQLVQAAPLIGKTVKDLSSAAATAESSPQLQALPAPAR